jgi:hypothetical protein
MRDASAPERYQPPEPKPRPGGRAKDLFQDEYLKNHDLIVKAEPLADVALAAFARQEEESEARWKAVKEAFEARCRQGDVPQDASALEPDNRISINGGVPQKATPSNEE